MKWMDVGSDFIKQRFDPVEAELKIGHDSKQNVIVLNNLNSLFIHFIIFSVYSGSLIVITSVVVKLITISR